MLFRYGLKNNLNFALPGLGNYFGGGERSFQADMVQSMSWNQPEVNIYAIHTKWNMEQVCNY